MFFLDIVLLRIYKSLALPDFGYADIQSMTNLTMVSFAKETKSMHYNAALGITGEIKGISQTKLYEKLGLGTLNSDVGSEDFVFYSK